MQPNSKATTRLLATKEMQTCPLRRMITAIQITEATGLQPDQIRNVRVGDFKVGYRGVFKFSLGNNWPIRWKVLW